MSYNRYNRITLLLFVATLLSVVMLAKSFWNSIREAELTSGAAPVIFFILSLIGLVAIYLVFRKATDEKLMEDEIDKRVAESRSKIFQELNKEKEEEEVAVEAKVDISEKVSNIIPKGNFKSVETFVKKLFENLGTELQIVQGVYYQYNPQKKNYSFLTGYALTREEKPADFQIGENLTGQAAKSGEIMVISDIPEEYFETESGLGKSKPKYLTIVPFVDEKTAYAVIEIATFIEIGSFEKELLEKAAQQIAEKLKQLKKS